MKKYIIAVQNKSTKLRNVAEADTLASAHKIGKDKLMTYCGEGEYLIFNRQSLKLLQGGERSVKTNSCWKKLKFKRGDYFILNVGKKELKERIFLNS